MSKAKWFAVRKPSTYRWDNCHISQSNCPAEIPRTYKNFVLYSPDPPFLLQCWRGVWDRDYTNAWTVNTLPVVYFQQYCLKHLLPLTCYLLEKIWLCQYSLFQLPHQGESSDEKRNIQSSRQKWFILTDFHAVSDGDGLNWYSYNVAIRSVGIILLECRTLWSTQAA